MFKKILVGTDFSEASDEARRVAIELARRLGAELEIVHVEEPPGPSASSKISPGARAHRA